MQLPPPVRNMYKTCVVLFLLVLNLQGRTIIQLKDFLCGCDYCDTVSTSEPLDIGRHMIMCHSWRDATLKTMNIMRQMEQEKLDLKKKAEQLEQADTISSVQQIITSNYSWMHHEIYGSIYTDTTQINMSVDRWVYTNAYKWVWVIADVDHFLYSYDYGWLYVTKYQQFKVTYRYDIKRWILPDMME